MVEVIDRTGNQTMTTESTFAQTTKTLSDSVSETLEHYFAHLDGQNPSDLYNMVLKQVEKPLVEMVLKLTNNNQSRSAKILGLSRGTLRKKMAIYQLT